MQVQRVMVSDVETLRPDSTIKEAAERMRNLEVGVLPVREGDKVVGVVTDRDIVIRSLAENQKPDQTRVREIMTKDIVFCFEDQSVREAAELMEQRHVGRLIVLNRDHKLSGILSFGNLIRHLGEDRLTGIISEEMSDTEDFVSGVWGRTATILGTIAGAATVIFGTVWLRNRPEILDRMKSKVRRKGREFSTLRDEKAA